MMNFDAFISYPHQDKATADAVCAALEAEGIRCWIAPRDVAPGAEWAASIVEAIDNCRVMVLIFSASANNSKQIRREVQRAFEREVPVVPFRIENVVPEKSLAYYMGPVHWLDALTKPLEQHLQRLVVSVRRVVPAQPSPADRPAVQGSVAEPKPEETDIARASTEAQPLLRTEPPAPEVKKSQASGNRSKWRAIGLVTDGRGRFAIGMGILMFAMLALFFVALTDYEEYLLVEQGRRIDRFEGGGPWANYFDFVFTTDQWAMYATLIIFGVAGVLAMRGVRWAKWPIIGGLLLSAVVPTPVFLSAVLVTLLRLLKGAGVTELEAQLLLSQSVPAVFGILGIFLCWKGWNAPLQKPLWNFIGSSAIDMAILFVLLVGSFWVAAVYGYVSFKSAAELYKFAIPVSSIDVFVACGAIYLACALFGVLVGVPPVHGGGGGAKGFGGAPAKVEDAK